MDETPRPLDRWLPLLGVALIVEAAAVAALPTDPHLAVTTVQIITAVLAALAGALTLVSARKPSPPLPPRAALWLLFLLVIGTELPWAVRAFGTHTPLQSFTLFQAIAVALKGFGTPLLWGAALARRESPGNADAQRSGRIGAGLVQVGFVFLFVAECQSWGMFQYLGSQPPAVMAAYTLMQLAQVAARVVLLWASIDSLRQTSDLDAVRARAGRIHGLLVWYILLSVLSMGCGWLFASLHGSTVESGLAWGWNQAVLMTLTVAAALLVLRYFRSYNSVAPSHPWSGAEA